MLKPFFKNAGTAQPFVVCAVTAIKPMATAKLHILWLESPSKARQNGWGIWLYNAGIRQGSSDFFSFSDDYKISALRNSMPSLLNEPSQQIQTSLCSADSPLLSSLQRLVHGFPAAIRQLSLTRTLYKIADFVVANAAPFFSLSLHAADKHGEWLFSTLKRYLPGRNVTTALIWVSPLCARGSLSFQRATPPLAPSHFFPPRDLRGKSSGKEDFSARRWVSFRWL